MPKNTILNNQKRVNLDQINDELQLGNQITIQFSEPIYDEAILADLDTLCKIHNSSLSIRFYGHYGTFFDCKYLEYLPSVKSLYLDCLDSVMNFRRLRYLQNMERLHIGIYKLEESDFLVWDNLYKLTELVIGDTKKNNIILHHLSNYSDLNTLFINGHIKGIDSIAECKNIKDLSLSIASKASISFINSLSNLKNLRFILGGRENLLEIKKNEIESLEIIRVRGFSSFGNTSDFRKLKRIQIEDQIQLRELVFDMDMPFLEDMKLVNCKNLSTCDGIRHLSTLNQMRIYRTDINFDKFIEQELPRKLRLFSFYSGEKKADERTREKLEQMGYREK